MSETQETPNAAQMKGLILQHWQEHRPRMFIGLTQMGRLDEAVDRAIRLTLEAIGYLVQTENLSQWAAWLAVCEEWALPPAEEEPDQPDIAISETLYTVH